MNEIDNFIEIYDDYIKVREATKQGYAIARGGDSINLEQPSSKTRRGRVGNQIANTLTCSCNQGVVIEVNTNKIIRQIIPIQVRVRKHEVDTNKLKGVLKTHKNKSKLTNKQISEALNQPLTLVEHWFRSDGSYEKSNRVYNSEGIAPTLTVVSAENERYIVREDFVNFSIRKLQEFMNKNGYIPKMFNPYNCCEIKDYAPTQTAKCGELASSSGVLIVGEKGEVMQEIIVVGNYSPSNHNASRIVDEKGISPTVMENHGTVTGVLENIKNKKGNEIMWKNELEKFEFDMEELRIFDAFAGIGSLHKSLKKLGVKTKITNLSEVDIDTIISYSGIHIENFKDMEFDYPSDEEMREWLMNRNIGYDFEKGKSKIPRLNKDKLKLLYKGSYILKNLGDVSQINPDEIEDFDIMNLSFCCQDLSNAGKQKGLRNEDGTPTRSGLIVPSLKLARAKKPKYIMIENVKALIQKKFIDDFYSIINELEEMGYNCYYPTKEVKKEFVPTCLNSKNYGIPQNRERIFVYAIRKDIDDKTFEFDYGYDKGIRLKHILEDYVDPKYYLSDEIQQRFKRNSNSDLEQNELNVVGTSAPECRTIGQRDTTYGTNGIMSTLTVTDYKQPKQILDNSTDGSELNLSKTTVCEQIVDEWGEIISIYNEEGEIEKKQLELKSDGVTNTLAMADNMVTENTNCINRIGGLFDTDERQREAGAIFNQEGIAPCLNTMQGGYRQPNIIEDKYYINKANNMQMKGNYIQYDNSGKGYDSQAARLHYTDSLMGTLPHRNTGDKTQIIEKDKVELNEDVINGRDYDLNMDFKIRKLTPLECWRLQGFDDDDFYKAKELGISDSQLYKQAGNSITVNVLYYQFKQLFKKYTAK